MKYWQRGFTPIDFGCLFDLGGVRETLFVSETPEADDLAALAADWLAVGDDLRHALDTAEVEE